MVLPRNETTEKALLDGKLADDKDAQVRMASLLAFSELPASEDVGKAVFAMLQEPRNGDDRWIPDAATAAAAKNDSSFLRSVLAAYKPVTPTAAAETPANALSNSSFEEINGERPSGWAPVTHGGRGSFSVADTGHSGGHSIKITSENGGDLSWAGHAKVKPRTEYKLTGWIKTEGLQKVAGGIGALLNVHEMQDAVHGATKGLTGDNGWTQVELTFNSGEMTEVTINCLFGGWGRAKGTAWFDDIELVPGPGSELAGEMGRIVRTVTTHYAQRAPSESIVATLAALKGASPTLSVAILDGLVSGWPKDKPPTLADADKSALSSLNDALSESIRDRLLALAVRWGQPEIFGANIAAITDSLSKKITDGGLPADQRTAAARRLIGIDVKPAVVDLILSQVSLLTPPDLGNGMVGALTDSRDNETGGAILGHWAQFTPSVKRAAVSSLMRRPEWTRALLDAVEKGSVARTDIAAEQWSQMKNSPNRMLARRAERLSTPTGAVSADREEIVKKLLPLAKEKGDPARGKEVFGANCAVCHTFNGQGGKVGPDLTGVGARDHSEILTDILDPNRSVEANYRLWNITTKAGETFSGRLDTETQTSVEILDTTGQKHSFQRSDISALDVSPNSIMPTGFESLPPDDIKSLLAYITQAPQ